MLFREISCRTAEGVNELMEDIFERMLTESLTYSRHTQHDRKSSMQTLSMNGSFKLKQNRHGEDSAVKMPRKINCC